MATLLRPLLLTGAVLGICHLAGVPLVDWIISGFQVVYYVITTMLWAFWQLLQPNQETLHSNLPELHQAVLNVTNDASRVADLLEEFMAQYSSDPKLKTKFLQFMAEQADTKYSVVDNKLNWVLWLYSLIWMPLLVLTCLTRMGKGSHEERQHHPVPAEVMNMNGTMPHMPPSPHLQNLSSHHSISAAEQAAGLGLNPAFTGAGPEQSSLSSSSTAGGTVLTPRQRAMSAGGSLDLPPRHSVPGSFGRPPMDDTDCSTRSAAASGRTLRQAMGSISERQRVRASSDRTHMSRPSKLQGSSSLPPNVLSARGANSSSFKAGPGGYGQGAAGARLSGSYPAEHGAQGANSRGADVRAVCLDQEGAGEVMWGMKGQQHQQGGAMGAGMGLMGADTAVAGLQSAM